MTMISSATSATTPRSCVIRITDESKSALEPVEQLEDLRLDGHVERRRRLVGDQDVRIAGERHRDHRALAHAARELVRVVVDALLGVRDADLAQELDGAPPRVASSESSSWVMIASTIWSPTVVHRVQRRHRVLEDHRDLVAAYVAQARLRHLEQVLALVVDLALEARVPVAREAEDRHRRDALARAGLADDPEHLAAVQLEVHAVDGMHGPVLGREPNLQAFDLEQALGH